jgi:CRP/FNR family transcriptional regulator
MINHLQPLIKKSTKRRFDTGSTIIYQGEVPRSATILTKGIVRVFSISPQGEEQIVTFHVAGEFFPTAWVFGKAPGTLFFYEALTDCEVAMCDRADLIEFMISEPSRNKALIDYFATNYAASMIRVNALEQPKARDKLVYTLYYLCQRYGKSDTNRIKIPLTLTHQNFASLVGLTRETTAIEMNKLKSEKIISYNQQEYIVNRERLLDILGEDSFRNLEISS